MNARKAPSPDAPSGPNRTAAYQFFGNYQVDRYYVGEIENPLTGKRDILDRDVELEMLALAAGLDSYRGARALTRRVVEYNATAARPSMLASTSAKVTATQTAFEVASDALQIFGGNGVSREYPMEKLFRDARAMLIADGNNEVLALKGGADLVNPSWL